MGLRTPKKGGFGAKIAVLGLKKAIFGHFWLFLAIFSVFGPFWGPIRKNMVYRRFLAKNPYFGAKKRDFLPKKPLKNPIYLGGGPPDPQKRPFLGVLEEHGLSQGFLPIVV